MVDASPEILNERQSELEKLSTQYGGGKGVDMSQFPQFKFTGMYLSKKLYYYYIEKEKNFS